jgi:hypothetical protein
VLGGVLLAAGIAVVGIVGGKGLGAPIPTVTATDPPVPTRRLTGSITVFESQNELFGSSIGRASSFTVEGSIPGNNSGVGALQDGASCQTAGGFSDVAPGRDVTVYGPTSEVLGTAPLGSGMLVTLATESKYGCQFSFVFPSVPSNGGVTIEVGSRGRLTYTLADLTAANWMLALRLDG